jgi:hypothetical protein
MITKSLLLPALFRIPISFLSTMDINNSPTKKPGSQLSPLERIVALFFPRKPVPIDPISIIPDATAQAPLVKEEVLSPVFWQGSVSGNFQVDSKELVIYFYVSRSASRAQKLKQEISSAGGSVEVLRLVGWDFSKPCVILAVHATSRATWECEQIQTEGIREPFGYVVISSSYVPGLVNSVSIVHEELYKHVVRFQVDENSVCVRLN